LDNFKHKNTFDQLLIYKVPSIIVEECIEEGGELPAGDGPVITEDTAVAITR